MLCWCQSPKNYQSAYFLALSACLTPEKFLKPKNVIVTGKKIKNIEGRYIGLSKWNENMHSRKSAKFKSYHGFPDTPSISTNRTPRSIFIKLNFHPTWKVSGWWYNASNFQITIENHSFYYTFLEIPASEKSDFQSMPVRLVNFNGGSRGGSGGWRRGGRWLGLALYSGRFSSFTIVDSPPVKSKIQIFLGLH